MQGLLWRLRLEWLFGTSYLYLHLKSNVQLLWGKCAFWKMVVQIIFWGWFMHWTKDEEPIKLITGNIWPNVFCAFRISILYGTLCHALPQWRQEAIVPSLLSLPKHNSLDLPIKLIPSSSSTISLSSLWNRGLHHFVPHSLSSRPPPFSVWLLNFMRNDSAMRQP